ncbi:hypothetical protein K469DRAFT_573773 [Zopfia rhizophila CBS 207.26]|uniref:Uncharacterized protein n=1 Tax=Zopfia rhizophila CBS 207.26 TaxID=1314779 RepID=A0A6A6E302_9PEZI|nr:hypothetical protein K469DRAFT_573773 [Zopfia rhizophila CBS 207.26]
MPSQTPNPHRFLTRDSRSTHKPKPNPKSGLRHGFTVPTPKSIFSSGRREVVAPESQNATPAKRFVFAPIDREEKRDKSTPHPKPRRKLERVESIEEGSQGGPSASPSPEDHEDGIVQTIEQSYSSAHTEAELLCTSMHHKRRRLSPPPLPTSPSHPILLPQTPAPAPATSSHRFLVPVPRTPAPFSNVSSTIAATTPAPSRPHFILPPQTTSPPQSAHPLPETFSPRKAGQKYVPGGLASTLQTWILDAANTGYAAQNSHTVVWGRGKEDGVKMRLKVEDMWSGNAGSRGVSIDEVECYPGGVVFARGDIEVGSYNASRVAGSGGDVRALLAGNGGVRSAGVTRVREGAVVGIKAPLWDVDIQGEKWAVGVDWVMLGS